MYFKKLSNFLHPLKEKFYFEKITTLYDYLEEFRIKINIFFNIKLYEQLSNGPSEKTIILHFNYLIDCLV